MEKRDLRKAAILMNALVIVAILLLSYRNFTTEAATARLLGQGKQTMSVYISSHGAQMASAMIVMAILICGIVLEILRSRFAIIINVGAPLCLLVMILVQSVMSWHRNPQEAEITLILVALPLALFVAFYWLIYRRDVNFRLVGKSSPR